MTKVAAGLCAGRRVGCYGGHAGRADASRYQAAPQGPTVKLVAAQKTITVQSSGGAVILDPGIYVVSLGSALQLDVQRASYTDPVTVAQVVHLPGSSMTRPWLGSVLDGFTACGTSRG